uniref:Uncharacterized protein n=1 Tax=Phyllostachys edulis TaxID=38705 RepID=D3IVF4_PHYED|nr:hypothetical protein [Phyllostachys edulis]
MAHGGATGAAGAGGGTTAVSVAAHGSVGAGAQQLPVGSVGARPRTGAAVRDLHEHEANRCM